MARKKLKHRTISFTTVGGEDRERAFPLARQAIETAQSGLCREAAIFVEHAERLGGGPLTRQAADAVRSCARPGRLSGLGSDTHYVDRTQTDRANSSDRDLRWQRNRLAPRRSARGVIAREITEEQAERAEERKWAAAARHDAVAQARADSYYDSDEFLRDEWYDSMQTEPYQTFKANYLARRAARQAAWAREQADAPRRARIGWGVRNAHERAGFRVPLIRNEAHKYHIMEQSAARARVEAEAAARRSHPRKKRR